jgi:hypothetical protein
MPGEHCVLYHICLVTLYGMCSLHSGSLFDVCTIRVGVLLVACRSVGLTVLLLVELAARQSAPQEPRRQPAMRVAKC